MLRFGIREFILLGVLLALPLAAYWLVFRPQNAEIAQARQEIEHKRELLDKLKQTTAQNASLEKANEEIRSSITAIEARLPSNKEVDAVVRQVSDLAVQAGLDSPAIESDKPVEASMYMEQPLKMKMTGNFNGFYDFLVKLEQLPRITRVPDLHLTRSTDTDGFMKADFVLSIYFQPEGVNP
ncbi:MAG: type 4a pilus biogenesis protein PilO [Phycisphaerales bacterium]|nr:type 4a pilus biogenesis protein PilO [Phycisphaerales bacterium]